MERLKRWWNWHKLDVYFFAGLVCLLAFVIGGLWVGHSFERDCMTAGYTRYKDGFCVRQVKGTDEMIPYEAVAK